MAEGTGPFSGRRCGRAFWSHRENVTLTGDGAPTLLDQKNQPDQGKRREHHPVLSFQTP